MNPKPTADRAPRPRKGVGGLLVLLVGLSLAAPATAQRPDYLTPEEVTLVRDTQEPDKRIALFLQISEERLAAFEKAAHTPPEQERPRPDELRDLLNDFIHAVDDTTAAVELPLERGGADLRKTRVLLAKEVEDFLARVKKIQETRDLADEELGYDLEDATLALQDLLELNKKIPDELIPPKQPRASESEETQATPGKPTLKRRTEKEPKPPF